MICSSLIFFKHCPFRALNIDLQDDVVFALMPQVVKNLADGFGIRRVLRGRGDIVVVKVHIRVAVGRGFDLCRRIGTLGGRFLPLSIPRAVIGHAEAVCDVAAVGRQHHIAAVVAAADALLLCADAFIGFHNFQQLADFGVSMHI